MVSIVFDITDRVYPEAYAESVECEIDELEARLSEYGFSWNPLSVYHYTPVREPDQR